MTPVNFGVLVFPGFQALDVFGPLDALNILSLNNNITLSIIAPTTDPISTWVKNPSVNIANSKFAQSILPTHTHENAPPLDVLIIPGGYGAREPEIQSSVEFIKKTYPTLQYVITVCTGSRIAAMAGILDGKKATSNKRSFAATVALCPTVDWVTHARWVVDGNIWTSSGVSAGIDVIFAFIAEVYGAAVADDIAAQMEYERHTNASWDPFADLYHL